MIALIIVLVILALILLLPLGARVRYDADGPWAAVTVGPVCLQLLPRREKKPRKPKQKRGKEKKPAPAAAPKPGGSVRDFWPFVELGFSFLGAVRRKLLLRELIFHVSFGGQDPAKTAIRYGQAQAVLGAVYPRLAGAFRIRRQDVGVHCDFTESGMRVYARLWIQFRVGDLLWLGIVYGVRALKTYLAFSKKRKAACPELEGGAEDTTITKGGATR